MKISKVHMDILHMDHRLWNTQLKFYKDELSIFTEWLGKVSAANTDPTLKVKVEQFQNRILLQNQAIEKLVKQIRSHESHLADEAKQNMVASDHLRFDDHTTMRNEMNATNSIQETLKLEFNRFVADNF